MVKGKICAGCDTVQKAHDIFDKHYGKDYCRRCHEEMHALGLGIQPRRLIELFWDNGECRELFITDAPKKAIRAAITRVRKIEGYCTDDFVDFLEKDYYIVQSGIEEYNF